jgi:hypothetical protein
MDRVGLMGCEVVLVTNVVDDSDLNGGARFGQSE